MTNIVGTRFGRLIVLDQVSKKGVKTYCVCLCDCGKTKNIVRSNLIVGKSKSCGCYNKELVSKRFKTHGMRKSKIYLTWYGMLTRCNNQKDISFKRYGGRGIKCLWKTFEAFVKDMGLPPTKDHSIDRINNNGNYCKENCRWATSKQQAQNTSKNVVITYKGETKVLSEWARTLNLNFYTLRHRLKTLGWGIQDAFTRKVRTN